MVVYTGRVTNRKTNRKMYTKTSFLYMDTVIRHPPFGELPVTFEIRSSERGV
jgi:hypothetical protein